MKLILNNNTEILSPKIACNKSNSVFGYEDRSIPKEIHKTGKSMVRNKLIRQYEIIKGREYETKTTT